MKNEIKGERKKNFLSWTFLDEFHEYIGSATEKEGSEKKGAWKHGSLGPGKNAAMPRPSILTPFIPRSLKKL